MLNKLFSRFDKVLVGLFPLFLILLVLSYVYIIKTQSNNNNYFIHNDNINKLIELDGHFDDFVKQNLEFTIFDDISSQVVLFEATLDFLINDASSNNFDHTYQGYLKNIKKVFQNKSLQLERLKSRKGFVYNTLSFIFDKSDLSYIELDANTKKEIDLLRLEISNVILGFSAIDKLDSRLQVIEELQSDSKYINNLISLVSAFKNYHIQIEQTVHRLSNININSHLNIANEHIKLIAQNEQEKAKTLTDVLYSVIFIFSLVILFGTFRLFSTKKELISFKTAVENSHSVVVITDINQKILFANEAFEKVTGYTKEEAIGQRPSVLKSGLQDDSFYKEMAEAIYNGKQWQGRFINKKKNGELFYEDATITPIVIDGKIENYLAIKLDVTQLVNNAKELQELNTKLEEKVEDKIKLLRQKDALIQQQSRLAALGEMIGYISHQWRQPLSSITIGASGMKYKKELGILYVDDDMENSLDNIIAGAEYLSQTIEDFKNFTKVDKHKKDFDICDTIENTYKIVKNLYISKSIDVRFDLFVPIIYEGYQSEFSQVIINILNNAKDVLVERNIAHRYIVVKTYEETNYFVVKISDNAGGIPEDIMSKIFDPYFTTKHQSQGTGIGLFMSHEIVTNHFNGELKVVNEEMQIDGDSYIGASFYIYLPK